MLNPNDATVSSKAFIGLCSFAILVINGISNLYWDKSMNESIQMYFVGIVLTTFGLSTYQNIKQMSLDSTTPPSISSSVTTTTTLAPNEIVG